MLWSQLAVAAPVLLVSFGSWVVAHENVHHAEPAESLGEWFSLH